jgi:enoyl-CoA hydratase
MDAEEAYAIGLIREIVKDPGKVLARAHQLAELILQHAPLAIRAAKEALLRIQAQVQSIGFSDVIEQCYASEDFRLGVQSFLKKEIPQWSGH